MPAYLRFYEKPDKPAPIKGEVKAKGHEGWIELFSVQYSASSNLRSQSVNRESGEDFRLNDIVVTKPTDSSTPHLFQASVNGWDSMIAVIDLVDDKGVRYMRYHLQNVMITSYSLSSGGDRPSESISLNFEKATYTMSPTSKNVTPSAIYSLQDPDP